MGTSSKSWWLNNVCGINHFIVPILILALIHDAPSYDTYQVLTPLNSTPYVAHKMAFNIQGSLCSTHAMSFAAHFVRFLIYQSYSAYVERTGTTPIRWVEYAMSAPLMKITIAVLSGVRDRAALIPIAGLVFATIVCGAIMQAAPSIAKRVCLLAFTLLTIASTQIWVSFSQYDDAPDFVAAIVLTQSILFYSFGFVPIIAWYYNKPIEFEEAAYDILSLVSKDLQSLLVAFGTNATS